MKFSKTLAAVAFSALSVSAFADITVQGSSFTDGASSQATAMGTFYAYKGLAAGAFDFKNAVGGYQGVGVEGATAGEVDIGESILANFNQNYVISQFTLGLLFAPPAHGDVQETAKVTVNFANATTTDYFFTATSANTATWSGVGSFVQNLSAAVAGQGGVWSILNPFGNQLISSISFTAVPGSCGGSNCNQSDFSLVSVTAVPEAETYAMMLAGLGLMGAIARRRNKAKSA